VAAAPAYATTCVPAHRRLRKLVDATRFTMSMGVAGGPTATGEGGGTCELAPTADGVDSRLMPARLGHNGAGEGAQIGGGGGSCDEVKFPSRVN
jgi:hypothetical protein